MPLSEPLTYDLGAHILTTQDNHSITIEDRELAIQLDQDEAYKLLMILQELFR